MSFKQKFNEIMEKNGLQSTGLDFLLVDPGSTEDERNEHFHRNMLRAVENKKNENVKKTIKEVLYSKGVYHIEDAQHFKKNFLPEEPVVQVPDVLCSAANIFFGEKEEFEEGVVVYFSHRALREIIDQEKVKKYIDIFSPEYKIKVRFNREQEVRKVLEEMITRTIKTFDTKAVDDWMKVLVNEISDAYIESLQEKNLSGPSIGKSQETTDSDSIKEKLHFEGMRN